LAKYRLKLFTSGFNQSARLAASVRHLCERLGDEYVLEVINVSDDPLTAETEKILATPTLIKYEPLPVKRIIGDISDTDFVLQKLVLQ
jgi:circadian clock protein KaiB